MVNFRNEKSRSNNSVAGYMEQSWGKKMPVALASQAAIYTLGNNFLPFFRENGTEILLGKKLNF